MDRKLTKEQREKISQKRRKSRKMTIKIASVFIVVLLLFFGARSIFSKILNKNTDNKTKEEIYTESDKETSRESKNETNLETKKELNTEQKKVSTTKSIEDQDISIDVLNNNEQNIETDKIENKYINFKISKKELNNKIAELPDELKHKIKLYPESQSTIINYKESEKNNISKDISKDLDNSKSYKRRVKLPYLNQWDERWGYEKVDDEYIAISGCGPTSLSMIYTGLTGDTSKNPFEMAKFAFNNGWYDKQGGKYELFTSGINKLGLTSTEIKSNSKSIKESLDEGKIIVALVVPNGYNDFSKTGGHYITITEYNEDDKLVIYDVNSYENTNKTWEVERVLAQVKVLYAISK